MSLSSMNEGDPIMKKWFYLRLSILVSCLLVSAGVPGFSFVTPEHYEKMKQEARSKERQEERSKREVPGKIQVHQPGEGQAPLSKPNPK